jgi:hypothetical protein
LARSQQRAHTDKKQNDRYSHAANAAMTFTMSWHVLIPIVFLTVVQMTLNPTLLVRSGAPESRAKNSTLSRTSGEEVRGLPYASGKQAVDSDSASLRTATGINYTLGSPGRDSVKQFATEAPSSKLLHKLR